MLDSIDLTTEELTLRDELRAWIADHRPPELIGMSADDVRLHGTPEQQQVLAAWTNEAAAAGYVCAGWPRAVGGRGLTNREIAILTIEFARASLPRPTRGAGESLVGPALIAHGTDAQKQQFLPPIRSGEHTYCQGFSEPDAGSDLASLRTRGEIDGDEIAVTGQKIWTSGADRATHIFVLCRTDPTADRHHGISYVLIPMRRPDGSSNGIEIRPIRQMTGQARFFETFLDNARAPLDHIVGETHEGWRPAMTTLTNERGGRAASQYLELHRHHDKLLAACRGRSLSPIERDRLAQLYIEMELLRLNTLRALPAGPTGDRLAGIHKALWSEHLQRAANNVIDVLGPAACGYEPDDDELAQWTQHFLLSRCHSIWGGSAEIQRNIIAERFLGLPKDQRRAPTEATIERPQRTAMTDTTGDHAVEEKTP